MIIGLGHCLIEYFGRFFRYFGQHIICFVGGDGRNGDTMAFSGLYVYEVDVKKGFRKLGGVDHGVRGAQCGTWWSNAQSVVKRSLFLDDLVYSVAQERARVQKLSALGTDVASLSLVP